MSKKLLVSLVAILTMFAISSQTMASALYKTIYMYEDQIWTDRYDNPGIRSCDYSYVLVNCHTVYPESGLDMFSKIQVQITDLYGDAISSIQTISEGAGDTEVNLLEGYLSTPSIYYKFRGNSNASAYAMVSYKDM